MRVLITGGAGFIGSHVADMLLRAGHTVAILDNLHTGKRENIPGGAQFYECDIRDPQLPDILRDFRPAVISHHAAQMSVRVSIQEPRFDASVNVEGGVHLLQSAIAAGVRKVIYASTGGAIYGEPVYLPCDEGHPIAPLCHYGVTKHVFEQYLGLYRRLYGLDYTILRYPNVFGPRQNPESEAGVVSIFAGKMLRHQTVTIYGSGEQERDFVFVGDVAGATLAALEGGAGGTFNLGSGRGTSVLTIYNLLAKIIGGKHRATFADPRLGEIEQIYLSGDRAQQGLGWAPTWELQAGLEATVSWLKAQAAAPQLLASR